MSRLLLTTPVEPSNPKSAADRLCEIALCAHSSAAMLDYVPLANLELADTREAYRKQAKLLREAGNIAAELAAEAEMIPPKPSVYVVGQDEA